MDTTRRAMAIGVSGVGVESGLCERVCTRAPHMLVRDPKSLAPFKGFTCGGRNPKPMGFSPRSQA